MRIFINAVDKRLLTKIKSATYCVFAYADGGASDRSPGAPLPQYRQTPDEIGRRPRRLQEYVPSGAAATGRVR